MLLANHRHKYQTHSRAFFEPGSIPTAMACLISEEGFRFNLIQKTPFFQKGVAPFDLIHLLARLGVVGINDFWFRSTTGT
jgi:hypothetical protein